MPYEPEADVECCFCRQGMRKDDAVIVVLFSPGSKNGTKDSFAHPNCLRRAIPEKIPLVVIWDITGPDIELTPADPSSEDRAPFFRRLAEALRETVHFLVGAVECGFCSQGLNRRNAVRIVLYSPDESGVQEFFVHPACLHRDVPSLSARLNIDAEKY